MTSEQVALADALSEHPEIRDALRARGLRHDNLRPLAEGYLQFLQHAALGGLEPSVAVRAFWQAHRASSDFAAFAQAHPELAPEPPEGVFAELTPAGYGRLYATVLLEEDHVDDAVWPAAQPPRKLGLTDREAAWLYALALALSLWLVYEVHAGALDRPILLVVPLFAAYAAARFYVGRAIERTVALTPKVYLAALAEAGRAWPIGSYEAGARRTRRVMRGWLRPRAA